MQQRQQAELLLLRISSLSHKLIVASMQNKKQPPLMGGRYACQNQEGSQIGMQAPLQNNSHRRLQTLFNNSHNKPDHPTTILLINLCLLSKTGCHTDFSLLLFLHAERGGERQRGETKMLFCSRHPVYKCVAGSIHWSTNDAARLTTPELLLLIGYTQAFHANSYYTVAFWVMTLWHVLFNIVKQQC